jgi:hypothetical protein
VEVVGLVNAARVGVLQLGVLGGCGNHACAHRSRE